MEKRNVAGLARNVVVGAGALVASGAALAQADYGALAADGVTELQGYFDGVYTAAIPVMLTIVGAMVAWKYAKKLFSKV